MRRFVIAVAIACSASSALSEAQTRPVAALPSLPNPVPASVRVAVDKVERDIASTLVGINLHPAAPRPKLLADSTIQAAVKGMAIRTIRFPNGCEADLYNWKKPVEGSVTVEQFLAFCDAVNTEAYYTLNMQGGTDGLAGPVPAGVSLEERIRYRHTAPNPCGNVDYHFGTLAESLELLRTHTIDRALAGKKPLLHYELGNENWGQSGTDWLPETYGKTCEAYASALRRALADAKKSHPQLAKIELYIVAVGFPSMGNNQDPLRAMDRAVNVAWTREVNRLANLKLIDAVQEHFYPAGNADGSTLLWTAHNLHNILCLRNGVPNDRLRGYVDAELAYHVPVEWTEWNLKCWGAAPRTDFPTENAGFEDGLRGWTPGIVPSGSGSVEASAAAARRGSKGLTMRTGSAATSVEVRRVFSVADRKPAVAFAAAVWTRTPRPLQTHVQLRQRNAGPNKGAILGDVTATQADMWERTLAVAEPKPDTTEIELVLRLEGPDAVAFMDEVQMIHWPAFSGTMPLAAARFEQQLFMVDALRELILWPTPRTHLHHLFGDYPCGALTMTGADRDNAAALRLLAGRIGTQLLRTRCDVATLSYDSRADKYATDFNALTPDVAGIPALATLATRDGNRLHLLLLNRTSDRAIRATIAIEGAAPARTARLCVLSGGDFDVAGAKLATSTVVVSANPFERSVPPHSAQVMTIELVRADPPK